MVPYTSAVYAEHVFREIGVDGNQRASLDTIDEHIPSLVQVAHKLKDLVKQMEDLDEIKGYIIYREESQEELEKQKQEE